MRPTSAPAAVSLLLLAAAPLAASRTAGVATAEAESTRVALELLGAGGNAADAAVGAALALAV
ncbi:MAG TPA: gamma-glutamyltransferase, partial [Thermoanaerobaculia bacterium]|nr:gamma-glutamyltransferase [Thermoanaerobaculia bacterium]